ncbi:MAG: hypothetical protein ABIP89_04685 [Polyangiaceae bacterium]
MQGSPFRNELEAALVRIRRLEEDNAELRSKVAQPSSAFGFSNASFLFGVATVVSIGSFLIATTGSVEPRVASSSLDRAAPVFEWDAPGPPSDGVADEARTAMLKGHMSEAKSLLFPRVVSGAATDYEVTLLKITCRALGDASCISMCSVKRP